MIFFILIYVIHGVFLIPEFMKTKKNEVVWRILTQIPLAFLLVAALIAERHFVMYDVLVNLAHFSKQIGAVMLKAQMLKNKSEIKVNPTYLMTQGVGLFVISIAVTLNFSWNTISFILQVTIGMILQIKYINIGIIGTNNFTRELILVAFFVQAPILWSRYEIMRRDLELFILQRKTEKQRAFLDIMFQTIPEHVIVVGSPEEKKTAKIKSARY